MNVCLYTHTKGVAFYIYKYPRRGLNPIYIHINPYIHTQGVAFYIYKYPRKGLNPIYVHINPKNGKKIFSMSPSQAPKKKKSENFALYGFM